MARARPERSRLISAIAISLLAAGASLVLFGGSGLLVGKAAEGGSLATLGGLLIVIELVAFFRAPLRFEERLITHRAALGSMVRWRLWLFNTVGRRIPGPLAYLSSGDLFDRTIEDIDVLEDLYVRVALPTLGAVSAGILTTVVVAFFSLLAAVIVFVGLIAGLTVAFAMGDAAAPITLASVAVRSKIAEQTVDRIDGTVELTMAGTTSQVASSLDALNDQLSHFEAIVGRLRGLGIVLLGFITGACVLGVALLSGSGVHHGSLTAGAAAGITLASFAGLEPLLGVLAGALRAGVVDAAAERLDELDATPIPVGEPDASASWPKPAPSIVLEDVTVGFEDVEILDRVTLCIAPGTSTCIVGPSGAGKSTLCNLMVRFVEPTAGTVQAGARSYADLSGSEVRRHVVYVDQAPTIFSGTIADLLTMGTKGIDEAACRTLLHDFELDELVVDDRLDRLVGEDGAYLSLGQQRRLSIARALLRHPDVLILDEPTAGLDPAQGRRIIERTLELAHPASVVVVTHDVSLVDLFDSSLRVSERTVGPLFAPSS
jgi:ABC-type transport system involved in cytochrome bd biosynthesis fused ATPase/permease subunit